VSPFFISIQNSAHLQVGIFLRNDKAGGQSKVSIKTRGCRGSKKEGVGVEAYSEQSQQRPV
jgi:Fe-S cluster assembly iron-binding protein IscA